MILPNHIHRVSKFCVLALTRVMPPMLLQELRPQDAVHADVLDMTAIKYLGQLIHDRFINRQFRFPYV